MKKITTIYFLFFCFAINAQELFKDVNGKYGIKDANGNVLFSGKYDEIYSFSKQEIESNAIKAKNEGKFGLIDFNGKILIPFIYEELKFNEEIAAVKLGENWGFVDKNGKEIIPFIYEFACKFDEGLSHVKLNGKVGYINKLGETVIPFEFHSAQCFTGEYSYVTNFESKRAFINKKGELLSPFSYGSIYTVLNDLAVVVSSDNVKEFKIILIEKNKVLFTSKNELYIVEGFKDGLLAVENSDKWGFINEKGEVVIDFKFDEVESFANGKAKVTKGKKVYYIDKTGQIVDGYKF